MAAVAAARRVIQAVPNQEQGEQGAEGAEGDGAEEQEEDGAEVGELEQGGYADGEAEVAGAEADEQQQLQEDELSFEQAPPGAAPQEGQQFFGSSFTLAPHDGEEDVGAGVE